MLTVTPASPGYFTVSALGFTTRTIKADNAQQAVAIFMQRNKR